MEPFPTANTRAICCKILASGKDEDSEVGVIPKGQAVVGPSTVLIYDTTLRGTCPRACRFLRTRWFVYNARRVCLILADTHMNSQLAHRAIP
jgi:hypothetical protein